MVARGGKYAENIAHVTGLTGALFRLKACHHTSVLFLHGTLAAVQRGFGNGDLGISVLLNKTLR